jgi:predicted methyltransferase
MPSFVVRKKLKPGAIFNIYLEVSFAGSELRRALEKKRINRKAVENALRFIRKADSLLLIRLPPGPKK